MSVDTYRTRRGYNYRCTYYKRDESGTEDNEQIIHHNAPNGVFYAKLVADNSKGTQDVANAALIPFVRTTIETNDNIDIKKADLVLFNNKIWIVAEDVREKIIQKNNEFSNTNSKITVIVLQKEN